MRGRDGAAGAFPLGQWRTNRIGYGATQLAGDNVLEYGHANYCSRMQIMLGLVANPEPLTPTEEIFWRALMRIVLSLPRQLHEDMFRAAGLTASEYTVIMNLSEAPNRQLRMADLASATGLSASRTTRLVDALQSHGLVAKRASCADGRSNLAELTSLGLAKLRSAWPVHVASVRGRVLDHIPPGTLAKATQALEAVAEQLEGGRGGAL
jgi:DNA-binding MarR family transcriptional regulator